MPRRDHLRVLRNVLNHEHTNLGSSANLAGLLRWSASKQRIQNYDHCAGVE
jgi:hypothetical protein